MLYCKEKLILIVLLVFSSQISFSAQKKYTPKQALREAYYYYKYQNYGFALPYFEMYVASDTTNAKVNFDIGECIYYSQQNKTHAIEHYERAITLKPEARAKLGELYHLKADFDKARYHYRVFLSDGQPSADVTRRITESIKQIDRAEFAMNHPTGAVITKLSDSVNSVYPDYVPILTPDGQHMYFTSRRKGSTGGIKDANGDYFEDIYVSQNIDGRWQKAENAGKIINSKTHDACLGITSNMQTMFIYRTNEEGTGGGIYESFFKDEKWSKPTIIEATFNSTKPEIRVISLTVAPDSVTYFYVSNAPGGYGGTDIYKVVRYGPNLWSRPQNLGPTINTAEDEDCPFIHYDGKTMFFSSKGHDSYGSFDIFKTELDDSGNWTKPVNMGYPLSSTNDDRAFMLMPDGKTGYYSSRTIEGTTLHDIYKVELSQPFTQYAPVKGTALTAQSEPSKVELKVFQEPNKEKLGSYFPSTTTGKFTLMLRCGMQYTIEVWSGDEIIDKIAYTVPDSIDPLIDQIIITLQR